MNATTDLDRLIASWLDSDGPRDVDASRLAETFALTAVSRQRRPVAPFIGPQRWPRSGARRASLRAVAVAAVLTLLAIAGAVILAGALRRPPTLLGIVEPGPRMAQPVFGPRIASLGDGRVVVAGTSLDGLLHVETRDATTGRFALAPGLDGLPSNGSLSLTSLPDGSALLVVAPFSSMTGRRGEGGVFRIGTSGNLQLPFRPALAEPNGAAWQPLTSWPARLREDGRVEWRPPARWSAERIVLFDPATNVFTSQDPTTAIHAPAGYQDRFVNTALPIAGNRWLIGGTGEATIFDPTTGEARPIRLPIGELGSTTTTIVDHAELLVDGRVFITGSDPGIYDARDASFLRAPLDLDLSFVLALRDGRLLLDGARGDPIAAGPASLYVFDPADGSYRQLGEVRLAEGTTITELPDGSLFAAVGTADGPGGGDAGSTWTMR
jgi:hypothetical protein